MVEVIKAVAMSKGQNGNARSSRRLPVPPEDDLPVAPNPLWRIEVLPWLAAALSGLLLVACFPKLHLPGLVWFACLPLLAALSGEKRLGRAFLLGYVCGLAFFSASCYWFVIVMQFYGHLPGWLAVLALVFFAFLDGTFFGGFGLAMGWAARRSAGWALALSPFLWVAMELARTYLISGFPWDLLGYAVQSSGIRQMAAMTGVYGLSFLAVATSALLAWVLGFGREVRAAVAGSAESGSRWAAIRSGSRRFERGPVTVLLTWISLLLLTQWWLAPPRVAPGNELAVLIQPDVPLDADSMDAWVPWRDPTQLRSLVQFSENAVDSIANRQSSIANPSRAPLLVWAENPAPFYYTRDPIFRNAVQNMARDAHAYVVVNTVIPVDDKSEAITNSAILVNPDGRQIGRYDKMHLVPFGEYVPWWGLPGLVHKITTEVGAFVPGARYTVTPSPEGGIGVFICYEAIDPVIARRLVANGAGVLVNISNDAWYGESAAAYQHLEMARMRALENHRYLLRATNNGVTAVVDPYGRVLASLPRNNRLALPARFDFETGQTFYSAHGDVFAWLAAALGVLMLLGGRTPRVRSEKLEVGSAA